MVHSFKLKKAAVPIPVLCRLPTALLSLFALKRSSIVVRGTLFKASGFFVPCTDGVVLITLHTEEALILPIEVREKEAPHADMMV